ncbi:MAG: DNA-primase RepB domain-containing protein [Candidatus Thiodiazotropha sp.]
MSGRFVRDPYVTHVALWLQEQGGRLIPDRTEAERFLQALDPDDDRFSFRTFSDSGYTRSGSQDPLEKALHGTLAECWDDLVWLNQAGAVITVTINQTNGTGREIRDITRVRAVFVDDDRGMERQVLKWPPHLVVNTSPGHFHYYWRVAAMPLKRFSEVQQRLAECYRGDRRVQALNQSMQVPGFWRRKRVCEPRLPRLIEIREVPPLGAAAVKQLLGD